MYARITRYKCDPARLEEMTGKIDEVKAQVKQVPGLVTIYSAWRDDGDGVTVAVYESQADAEAAMPTVQAVWAGLSSLLIEPPSAEAYENVAHLTG